MAKLKKYQAGAAAAVGGASSAAGAASGAGAAGAGMEVGKFGQFMGNYGTPIAGAVGTLMPLLMKKPDPNAKPYKKGSKLIKYEDGTKGAKNSKKDTTSQFSDPEVQQIVNLAKSRTGGNSYMQESLTPLETLRIGQVTPTIEDVKKDILKEQGEVPSKSSGYSGKQSGIIGGLAALAKSGTKYGGRGKSLIVPASKILNYALPFAAAGMNYWDNKKEEAGETIIDWKNAGLQTLSDVFAVQAGRRGARMVGRPFLRKMEDAKKVREQVSKFEEAKSKYPEGLITWQKQLDEAKAKDAAMSMAEKKQRLEDFNSNKIKYLFNEQEVLANKPRKPSLKGAQTSKPLMERFKESAAQEANKLGSDLGMGIFNPMKYIKSLTQLSKDEEAIRRAQGKVKTLTAEEKRLRRNEIGTNIGTGILAAGSGLGSGYLINRALSNKEKPKEKKKSNK